MEISNKNSLSEKQAGYSIDDFHKRNINKRVILVDDEQDILSPLQIFFEFTWNL